MTCQLNQIVLREISDLVAKFVGFTQILKKV